MVTLGSLFDGMAQPCADFVIKAIAGYLRGDET